MVVCLLEEASQLDPLAEFRHLSLKFQTPDKSSASEAAELAALEEAVPLLCRGGAAWLFLREVAGDGSAWGAEH